MKLLSLFFSLGLLFAGCNGCATENGQKKSNYNAEADLKKRQEIARKAGKDITVAMENGTNLRLEKDMLIDAKTNQPFSGDVNGSLAMSNPDHVVKGKLVNGKWDGAYQVEMTENGRRYVGVKRTYKNGNQTGTSYVYFPSGKMQAEFKFNDQGGMICAINYNESGQKTLDSCNQNATNQAK